MKFVFAATLMAVSVSAFAAEQPTANPFAKPADNSVTKPAEGNEAPAPTQGMSLVEAIEAARQSGGSGAPANSPFGKPAVKTPDQGAETTTNSSSMSLMEAIEAARRGGAQPAPAAKQ